MSSIVEGINLPIMQDRWIWSLTGSGEFSVASVRSLIDDHKLSEVSSKTRWIKTVPGMVNIHAWRVKLDSLPTRLNLSRRGMELDFYVRIVKRLWNHLVISSLPAPWAGFSACSYGIRIRICTDVFSIMMGKSDSYLGGASRVRVCSHGGSLFLYSVPRVFVWKCG
nr:RNA-directed DNA polymerase, eukaryota [Tanacetum cinerariifolium]